MDLQDNLIESIKGREKSSWRTAPASLAIHALILAFVVFMSAHAVHKVNAKKPIRAFLVAGAAPPPPPPPPPPAGHSSAPKATPKLTPVHQAFIQPKQIPTKVPDAQPVQAVSNDNNTASSDAAGVPGGVDGGVAGGVVGGQIGGVLGGQLGGTPGGQLGGTVGGTGDAKPADPPPAPDTSAPLRVGGDVKAPVAIHRTDPQYPDLARKSRVAGVVILEAIIDKDGNVDQVKVLKGLPMGMSEAAEQAVKQWKFKPGTLNGEPVDVIFNLTVNFTLQ
jgi:protein TonB